jgi:membrane protease YdiL (CAAX protease family)
VRIPELTIAGVILAGLFESRRTLVTPIAAHMTLNLIAVTVALANR